MKYWILRKMYELSYWLCDKCAPSNVPVFRGFYTRFRKPDDVKDHELGGALRLLLEEAEKE